MMFYNNFHFAEDFSFTYSHIKRYSRELKRKVAGVEMVYYKHKLGEELLAYFIKAEELVSTQIYITIQIE